MLMFELHLPVLCLVLLLSSPADAFVSPRTSSRISALNAIDFGDAYSFIKKGVRVKKVADLLGKDKDGNVVNVPVKNIERVWKVDDIEGEGDFNVNLFVPKEGEVKGCAFFMHGFSQYPVAYRQMMTDACEKAQVAVIAVETGITDSFVRKVGMSDRNKLQENLQRTLSMDTKQCMKMVLEDDDAFAEYGITKRAIGNKIAVMGHSMGGGLSFPVAADCNVDYVFTMAPAYGVSEFDPISAGVQKKTPKHSLLLAGGWDLIARASKVEQISGVANSIKKDSSIYVKIDRGLHTGFEDNLVLFNVPISSILKGAGLVGKIFGFADYAFFSLVQRVWSVIAFGRTRTGQVDGSSALMCYFMSAMVSGESITLEAAEKYLDDNIADIFENKFNFKYGKLN